MDMVAVLGASGKKLMPTSACKARKLLKKNRAVIHQYRPVFTIRLLDRTDGETQPVEYCSDTGYLHVGVSIKSAKREYVNEQRDLLADEPERHNDRRKYRRSRRNRKTRHRKPRWENRRDNKICRDGFTPSLRNKRDVQMKLYQDFHSVIPVTAAAFEMGQFDTQVLKAMEEGKPLPQGTDYQHGEQYGYETLREAVFARDGYRCACCGKSTFSDNVILRVHHLGYRKGDRSNRMSNLVTVCTGCHTGKNHRPGGKLYDWNPKLKSFKGAAFMTAVRYDMFEKLKQSTPEVELHMTYGAMTKLKRKECNLKKSHSNDAYSMGEFHPKHRTDFRHFKKRRRNSRILSKFYDARYTDTRDGIVKSGQQLSSGRTNRSEPRVSGKSERVYRGRKVSKGRLSVRKKHYSYRPGDLVLFDGRKTVVTGVQNRGDYVKLENHKVVSVKKIQPVRHTGGWQKIS